MKSMYGGLKYSLPLFLIGITNCVFTSAQNAKIVLTHKRLLSYFLLRRAK